MIDRDKTMKFRDPKTGYVFDDIGLAYFSFCYERDCDAECPLSAYKECFKWSINHPAEAALTMGYEVVKDEMEYEDAEETMTEEQALTRLREHTQYYVPVDDLAAFEMACDALERLFKGGDSNFPLEEKEAPMVKTDKPFICKRLGVEVGEWFQTLMFNETAIKDELYFCVEPDGTFKTKPPNVSGSAVTFLKTIEHPDCVIHKPRFTQEEVADAEAIQRLHQTAIEVERYLDGELGVRNTSCCLFNIRNSLFPSLRPGQSVKLSEIVGGNDHVE